MYEVSWDSPPQAPVLSPHAVKAFVAPTFQYRPIPPILSLTLIVKQCFLPYTLHIGTVFKGNATTEQKLVPQIRCVRSCWWISRDGGLGEKGRGSLARGRSSL